MSKYKSIVILTGAGISAESGIKTFRDDDGLWENHKIEDVAYPKAFTKNPTFVNQFYNGLRQQLLTKKPNAAHYALAEFEKQYQGEYLLVTQNVDDLHDRAGSIKLLHMHGELFKMRCTKTGKIYPTINDITETTLCQCCQTPTLRPHVVWFTEMPYHMKEIDEALTKCDLFVSIGTSGNVYPASNFVEIAKYEGAHTVELNLQKTPSTFNEAIYGKATEIVPQYLNSIL